MKPPSRVFETEKFETPQGFESPRERNFTSVAISVKRDEGIG